MGHLEEGDASFPKAARRLVCGVGREEGGEEEHEQSQPPFGFWTGLPFTGGSRFPVPRNPGRPWPRIVLLSPPPRAARAAFGPTPLLLLPSTWMFLAH